MVNLSLLTSSYTSLAKHWFIAQYPLCTAGLHPPLLINQIVIIHWIGCIHEFFGLVAPVFHDLIVMSDIHRIVLGLYHTLLNIFSLSSTPHYVLTGFISLSFDRLHTQILCADCFCGPWPSCHVWCTQDSLRTISHNTQYVQLVFHHPLLINCFYITLCDRLLTRVLCAGCFCGPWHSCHVWHTQDSLRTISHNLLIH